MPIFFLLVLRSIAVSFLYYSVSKVLNLLMYSTLIVVISDATEHWIVCFSPLFNYRRLFFFFFLNERDIYTCFLQLRLAFHRKTTLPGKKKTFIVLLCVKILILVPFPFLKWLLRYKHLNWHADMHIVP